MYNKVSIPRNPEGGAPAIKNPTVILVDIEDIESEPTRSLGNTVVSGNLTLKTNAKAVGIYATPSTIIPTEEQSGDVDARGITKGVEYVHPGNSVEIANHTEAYLNRPVVILVKECDGANGKCLIIGSKCNPLYMQPEYTNSNEASNRKFVWKQNQPDKFVIGTYNGTEPDLADESDESDDSGSGSGSEHGA